MNPLAPGTSIATCFNQNWRFVTAERPGRLGRPFREREIEIDDCRPEGASWGALKLAQGGGNGPQVREARCEGWLGRPERQVLE